jgi:hypothetical protein
MAEFKYPLSARVLAAQMFENMKRLLDEHVWGRQGRQLSALNQAGTRACQQFLVMSFAIWPSR